MDICTPTPSAAVSPLRQRMLDDMRMRQFAEHTQDGYIRAVRKLATFLGYNFHSYLLGSRPRTRQQRQFR